MKRILLTTTGSLGDLHPILAIGLGLHQRGYRAVVATSNLYRDKILQTGLEFAPMGPHLDIDPKLIRRVFDPIRGPEILMRKVLYPAVPAAYADIMEAVRGGCDLMVTHPIAFAAQIAAQKLKLPWVSTITAPMSLPSRYDPPVYAMTAWIPKLRDMGPAVNGFVLRLSRAAIRHWMKPVAQFRLSLGLPPGEDPLFNGQHSPDCVLAMFSRAMASPQPDWPRQTRVIGFPFYDQVEQHGERLDPGLERFLDAGPPPVVFTLGSSAVFDAGRFYHESLAAVKQLGCRAVLLVGLNRLNEKLSAGTVAYPWAPYSQIFPRAAAIVHQGGIGTCGQALAAGKPMLVMPFGFDQFDNAARLERLGVARVIRRKSYASSRAAAQLEVLLTNGGYARRAAEIACQVRVENAVAAACDAIAERLNSG
ncbi:MAG TPA: glycosyltransferase [Bryobacteraceae bacterium]|nr:glycosyltransferase [Bryobacteraceae bacterium]